jgi:hypothetical protein
MEENVGKLLFIHPFGLFHHIIPGYYIIVGFKKDGNSAWYILDRSFQGNINIRSLYTNSSVFYTNCRILP